MHLPLTGLRKGPLQICASDMELPCARGRATSCLSPSLPDPPSHPGHCSPSRPFSLLLLLSPNQGKKSLTKCSLLTELPSKPAPLCLLPCPAAIPFARGCCGCELRKSRVHSSTSCAGHSGLGNTSFPRLCLSRSHGRLQFSTGVALSLSPSSVSH